MRRALPGGVAVKATGGIRTASAPPTLLEAGAARLGTSAGDRDREAAGRPCRRLTS